MPVSLAQETRMGGAVTIKYWGLSLSRALYGRSRISFKIWLRAIIGALITILPNGIRNPPLCAKGDTRSSTDGMCDRHRGKSQLHTIGHGFVMT
ncbi:hypothetical protein BDQ94DRAFT_92408 [Aspergillus welwitschiae]|uniref:Uncharacterized protein n=1 Tax=Aspergillus welwitschiae TaxID=1341132 RepID=A0A3F3QFG9_9EURO|nr:hypothetical protein BDQ94DRAFT_92408 [Aspergillus welwitschiae]RDH37749.1 hypothetical protein BDQ94DRAFT_92408 [Aspergillus welwitschiae]